MTKYDFMRASDNFVYYMLIGILVAILAVLIVPGVFYLTTDHKATLDLAAQTRDESFQSWLSSNNYELVGVEVTVRNRGIIKVKAKTSDKE